MVSGSPDSSRSGATLSEPIRRLRLSLKEATDSRNDSEVLSVKVRVVLENLVRVADAARGAGVDTGCTRPSVTEWKRPGDMSPRRTAGQDGFRNSLLQQVRTLTTELRSQKFAPETLQKVFSGPPGYAGEDEVPPGRSTARPGEKAVALAFEIASYVSLRDAGPEPWAHKGASVAAHSSGKDIEAAVKVAQYLLWPSPVTMANDVTKMLGDAVANINEQRLRRCVDEVARAVAAYDSSPRTEDASSLEKPLESPSAHAPTSARTDRPSVTEVGPDRPSQQPTAPRSSGPSHPKDGPAAPGPRGFF